MYEIRDGIPDLGIFSGDLLSVDPSDENPYILTRFVSRQVAERMILISPRARRISTEGPSLRLV